MVGRSTRVTKPQVSRYTRSHSVRRVAAVSSTSALSGSAGWSRAQEASEPQQDHS